VKKKRAKARKRRRSRKKKLSEAVKMAPTKNTCRDGMSMRRKGCPPAMIQGARKRIR
jgi:hypothetical protein